MDDVRDMDNSTDAVEQPLGQLGRRDFLTRAAAAGAVAWVTPMILSRSAHALDAGGTPKCRPTISLDCLVHDCEQGQKKFPGVTVTTSDCPCSTTTPPKAPTTCIKITDLSGTCDPDMRAYGNDTTCEPPGEPDEELSTGDWECFDTDFPVFFGRARSGMGGAIPALSDDCTITLKMGVWAGECPDMDSPAEAFTCQTFDVTIVWDQGSQTIESCTFTPDPANTLCTGVGATPPCTCP